MLTTGMIGEKILDAGKKIPCIIDRGGKETDAEGVLEDGNVHGVSVKDLITEIKEKTGGKSFKPLPWHLRSRPSFVG